MGDKKRVNNANQIYYNFFIVAKLIESCRVAFDLLSVENGIFGITQKYSKAKSYALNVGTFFVVYFANEMSIGISVCVHVHTILYSVCTRVCAV